MLAFSFISRPVIEYPLKPDQGAVDNVFLVVGDGLFDLQCGGLYLLVQCVHELPVAA